MKEKRSVLRCIFTLLALFSLAFVYAQEYETPLYQNWQLKQYDIGLKPNVDITKLNSNSLNKIYSNTRFPLIDNFDTSSSIYPDTAAWLDNHVSIINRYAIFDAQEANGITYQNTDGVADILSSNYINTSNITFYTFMSFVYSTGSTWQTGDSLVLQIKNPDQTWKSIWQAPTLAVSYREVLIDVNLVGYKYKDFQFRFVNYSKLNSGNTENYLLGKIVFTAKGQLGFHDSFKNYNTQDSTPMGFNWAYHQNKVKFSEDVNYVYGNAVIFDSQNAKGQTYSNSSGGYGGADTLVSVPFDLANAANGNDSITLSFSYRAMPNAKSSDSLILEFRNRFNNWVRAWAVVASPSNVYSLFTRSINVGNNRHRFFQFRLINKSNYNNSDTLKWAVSGFKLQRSIFLPFFDDFSSSKDYPRQDIWVDKNVFVNNDFPTNQPSINVATFDGLDEFGNAYSTLPIKGAADKLTTASLNIAKYFPKDSLYLSFQYQYQLQGNPNSIFPDDSLMVFFRSDANDVDAFEPVLLISAEEAIANEFKQVVLPVKDSFYFHNDFQIRFVNRGSLTGNLGQWHIDYVRLGTGRSFADSNINDVALTNTPTSLLTKYHSMPYAHYSLNPNAYLADTQSFNIYNNNIIPYPVDYKRRIFGPEGNQNFLNASVQPTLFGKSDTAIKLFNKASPVINFNTSLNLDSLVFTSTYKISNSTLANDQVPSNDTCSVQTIFSNYFAYDDGTAESGYAIRGKNNAGGALAYDLEKPDSLYGMYVFFNQAETNVSAQTFNLYIWQNLSGIDGYNPASPNVELYKIANAKPIYANKKNGFAYFKFDSAVAVPNRFYMGWTQISPYLLNIGLDKNYTIDGQAAVNPNMFSFYDGVWNKSTIKGAMMMRPIVGKWLEPTAKVSEVTNVEKTISVYPNPASNIIQVGNTLGDVFELSLYDLTGKEILNQISSNSMDIQAISDGLYILRISNTEKSIYKTEKIIIKK